MFEPRSASSAPYAHAVPFAASTGTACSNPMKRRSSGTVWPRRLATRWAWSASQSALKVDAVACRMPWSATSGSTPRPIWVMRCVAISVRAMASTGGGRRRPNACRQNALVSLLPLTRIRSGSFCGCATRSRSYCLSVKSNERYSNELPVSATQLPLSVRGRTLGPPRTQPQRPPGPRPSTILRSRPPATRSSKVSK